MDSRALTPGAAELERPMRTASRLVEASLSPNTRWGVTPGAPAASPRGSTAAGARTPASPATSPVGFRVRLAGEPEPGSPLERGRLAAGDRGAVALVPLSDESGGRVTGFSGLWAPPSPSSP